MRREDYWEIRHGSPRAADDVWEFFFCAPPLKVTTAAGSPINPLAIK
ncbi:MAG: hypothetical protein ABW298_13070 [Candidatus Binatia bacterium]